MTRAGTMHAATIDNSPRLRRTLEYLRTRPATTLEIIQACGVCAVNSIITELRMNGFRIDCSPVKGERGVYLYTLEEGV